MNILESEPLSKPCLVLIADDDRDSREALGDLLRLSGNCVAYACNGTEALNVSLSANPDVLILDIEMPGLSGYVVCQKLRLTAGFESTRIYALSGLGGPEHEQRCHEAGFSTQLQKPLDPDKLTHLLDLCNLSNADRKK